MFSSETQSAVLDVVPINRGAEAPPRFLDTEAEISRRLGRSVEDPIRVFDVDGLGIGLGELQRALAPSYRNLPWDEYDSRRARVEHLKRCFPSEQQALDGFLVGYFAGVADISEVQNLVDALSDRERRAFDAIKPFRRRAVASFAVRHGGDLGDRWLIERQPDLAFRQSSDHKGDYRSLERWFAPSTEAVTDAPVYRALIARLATVAREARGGSVRSMTITCHQMGLVAQPSSAVTNAPEGIHQDGSDYIVSALVVERRGVTGGESIVYGPDKQTELLRRQLSEGEGIFQSDVGSPLWHWVTPVRPIDPESTGEPVRNILGYDIQID